MRRGWILAGILAVLIVGAVLLSGSGGGSERGPTGILALRRLLSGMGMAVRDAQTPPSAAGVFVLLNDLRTPDQARDLISWAQGGGTLVIADPQSQTAAAAGVLPQGRVGHYAFGPAKLDPSCAVPETVGVKKLSVDPADSSMLGDSAGVNCFPATGGAFEVSQPIGSGRIVVLGGVSPLTNALLGSTDNATFALQLFGSGGPVVFGPPLPPGAAPDGGVWQALPAAAKVVLIQIALALIGFAFVRGRRLGKPVSEWIPSPVPSGELVAAVGRLYRTARARAWAADTLRRATRRRLRSRLGLGPETGPETGPGAVRAEAQALSSTVGQISGATADEVDGALYGPAPSSEEELIALGRELEELQRKVEGSWS